jgi:hypothetical protein
MVLLCRRRVFRILYNTNISELNRIKRIRLYTRKAPIFPISAFSNMKRIRVIRSN